MRTDNVTEDRIPATSRCHVDYRGYNVRVEELEVREFVNSAGSIRWGSLTIVMDKDEILVGMTILDGSM